MEEGESLGVCVGGKMVKKGNVENVESSLLPSLFHIIVNSHSVQRADTKPSFFFVSFDNHLYPK